MLHPHQPPGQGVFVTNDPHGGGQGAVRRFKEDGRVARRDRHERSVVRVVETDHVACLDVLR